MMRTVSMCTYDWLGLHPTKKEKSTIQMMRMSEKHAKEGRVNRYIVCLSNHPASCFDKPRGAGLTLRASDRIPICQPTKVEYVLPGTKSCVHNGQNSANICVGRNGTTHLPIGCSKEGCACGFFQGVKGPNHLVVMPEVATAGWLYVVCE